MDHWVTLLRARAIENQCYIAGVNRVGEDPNTSYPGRSLIVDPQGKIVADAGDAAGVVCRHLAESGDRLFALDPGQRPSCVPSLVAAAQGPFQQRHALRRAQLLWLATRFSALSLMWAFQLPRATCFNGPISR